MEGGLIFIISLFLISSISLGLWILYLYFKKEEDLTNSTIILNFLSKYTHGRAFGLEKNVKYGKGNREIITFLPLDIDKKNIENLKDEQIIIEQNKIISLPKGASSLSNDKNFKICLPPSASDFPEILKNSELGKALMLLTEIKNAVNSELDAVKEGSQRKSEILKRLGDGELSREHLITVDELQKDLIKLVATTKDKDKPISTFQSPQSPSISL